MLTRVTAPAGSASTCVRKPEERKKGVSNKRREERKGMGWDGMGWDGMGWDMT